ncbi:MAG: hypothetical protein RIR00_2109 [Pseudomonadota bacterium]|jgi:DNA-nicking Smr family endonuclease
MPRFGQVFPELRRAGRQPAAAGTLPPAAAPAAEDDHACFRAAMADVVPLPPADRVQLGTPPARPLPRQSQLDESRVLHDALHGPIDLLDRLEGGDESQYLRPGLPRQTLKDLRRGRWVIQGEIDLHGMNRDEARHALSVFLAEELHHGKRCLRVIHGKGLRSPGRQAILRQLVRGWLAQKQEVLAYCQAPPADGGEGAVLVLLRASRK